MDAFFFLLIFFFVCRSTPSTLKFPDRPIGCQSCLRCFRTFPNTTQLNRHAKESGHKAYGCPCGANFSRFDALARHVKSKPDSLPQHPCMLCHGRQGASGFSRRDHLVQHLTGYHKVDGDIISTLIASIPMVAGTATDEGGSSAQQAQAPPSSVLSPGTSTNLPMVTLDCQPT